MRENNVKPVQILVVVAIFLLHCECEHIILSLLTSCGCPAVVRSNKRYVLVADVNTVCVCVQN